MIDGLRVAIVGGGWYGCHLASVLIEARADVQIFERSDDLFMGASAVNQNRLHMGFHYPRSFRTRKQIILGYDEFLETYLGLVSSIEKNIYAVAEHVSLLDFETYAQIMQATGLPFQRIELDKKRFREIDGAILCDEQLLHTNKAREFFRGRLDGRLCLGTNVETIEQVGDYVFVNGARFDYVLNCTWCTDFMQDELDVYFEPTIMLFYRSKDRDFAFTLMDGDFYSIYPFEEDIVTLTAVRHTPLGQYASFEEAKHRIDHFTVSEVEVVRQNMEALARHYFPPFDESYEFSGHALSMKTKVASNTAARECVVLAEGRMITVFAGKIDTVFTAERQIMKLLTSRETILETVSVADRVSLV